MEQKVREKFRIQVCHQPTCCWSNHIQVVDEPSSYRRHTRAIGRVGIVRGRSDSAASEESREWSHSATRS